MLLRAAAGVMPEGVSLDIATIVDMPLYNADVEAEQGIPAPVQALKDRIAAESADLTQEGYLGLLRAAPVVHQGAIVWN